MIKKFEQYDIGNDYDEDIDYVISGMKEKGWGDSVVQNIEDFEESKYHVNINSNEDYINAFHKYMTDLSQGVIESKILKFNESTDVDNDTIKDMIEEIISISEEVSNYTNKLKAFKKKLGEHTDSESIDENDQLDDAIIEIDSTTSKLDDVVTQLDNANVSLKDYIEKGKQYLY